MALKFHFSNHLEALEAELWQNIAASALDPFLPEYVIIPNSAVQRSLTLSYTRYFGVCANVSFEFLAKWLWWQMRRMMNSVSDESPLAPETLTWRILRLLNDDRIKGLPRLREYLANADATMRYELADRIGQLFDRYLTYRPEWLTAWGQGLQPDDIPDTRASQQDAQWQRVLWKLISEELSLANIHPIDEFLAQLKKNGDKSVLPARLSLFMLPDLPPLHLKALEGLSHWMEIDAYFLNPCREYWFDIVQPKRLAYLRQKGDIHAETGNRLLASWGQSSNSTLKMLFEQTSGLMADEQNFVDGVEDTLLSRVQQAILELCELEPESLTDVAGDGSIQVHCCHGINRQLEVLHDCLLAEFRKDGSLALDQIIVLVPDLQSVAGSINAVFGGAPRERRIPFHITGLPMVVENTLARVLVKLLQLPGSRFEASRVLDLLEEPVLAKRFALDVTALEPIRQWLKEAGIRWSLDAEGRKRLSGVADPRHTFEQGITRLFLGYALPGINEPIAGLLPAGNIHGSHDESTAKVFARFALAVASLGELAERVRLQPTPREWRELLDDILENLLEWDDSLLNEEKQLRQQISMLADAWQAATFDAALPVEVVLAALEKVGNSIPSVRPEGTLTFAPLSGMRGLPYRQICLLNMNDKDFPCATRQQEFDLMSLVPRPGDRQRAQDDRAIFLESLLAARQRLWIAYNGKSPRDNQAVPPSLLVAQLLDELAQACVASAADSVELLNAKKHFVIEHPLQAFSKRYFNQSDPRLFSFSQEYAAALNQSARISAESATAERQPPVAAWLDEPQSMNEAEGEENEDAMDNDHPRFFVMPVALSVEQKQLAESLSLEGLKRFFRDPCQFWVRNCLGIHIAGTEDEIVDVEPLLLDRNGERNLFGELAELSLSRVALTAQQAQPYAMAGIELPSGLLGESLFEELWREVESFVALVAPALATPILPNVPFELKLAANQQATPLKLTGALTSLRSAGIVRYSTDQENMHDLLGLWLEHLVLCAIRPQGVEIFVSTFWGRTSGFRFDTVNQDFALEQLSELAGIYASGLHQPIPFFPRSALAWLKASKSSDPMVAARSTWSQGDWPECEKPYFRLALRGLKDPLTENIGPENASNFQLTAERVLNGIMDPLIFQSWQLGDILPDTVIHQREEAA